MPAGGGLGFPNLLKLNSEGDPDPKPLLVTAVVDTEGLNANGRAIDVGDDDVTGGADEVSLLEMSKS